MTPPERVIREDGVGGASRLGIDPVDQFRRGRRNMNGLVAPERGFRKKFAGETHGAFIDCLRPSRGVGEKRPSRGGGSGAAKRRAFGILQLLFKLFFIKLHRELIVFASKTHGHWPLHKLYSIARYLMGFLAFTELWAQLSKVPLFC